MLFAFIASEGRLEAQDDAARALSREHTPVWIDLAGPSAEELGAVRERFGLEFSDVESVQHIESSARYFQTASGDLHLRAEFLRDDNEGPENTPVQFVITGGTLVSYHEADVPTLRLMRERAASNPGECKEAKDVLLEIYATDVEYCADLLEGVHRQLKGASKTVLTRVLNDKLAGAVLGRIARQEDLNGNVRHNVADNRRALSFLSRERLLSDEQAAIVQQIAHDLDSLDAYTAFLFDKINFLMDATVGFLTVEQNNVVKIFSVAAVAMLPPTLIASIYGMNFKHMPELDWTLGYPLALGLMALSVVLPFWWFKRKGWLGSRG
jgi:magnesium transporter